MAKIDGVEHKIPVAVEEEVKATEEATMKAPQTFIRSKAI